MEVNKVQCCIQSHWFPFDLQAFETFFSMSSFFNRRNSSPSLMYTINLTYSIPIIIKSSKYPKENHYLVHHQCKCLILWKYMNFLMFMPHLWFIPPHTILWEHFGTEQNPWFPPPPPPQTDNCSIIYCCSLLRCLKKRMLCLINYTSKGVISQGNIVHLNWNDIFNFLSNLDFVCQVKPLAEDFTISYISFSQTIIMSDDSAKWISITNI